MEINWNAMTAISTFFMMLFTFFLALIACKALNSWKYEIKQNKLHILSREYFDILKDIECVIEYKNTYTELEAFHKIWENFKKLGTLNLELALINKEAYYDLLNGKIFILLNEYTSNNYTVNNKTVKNKGAEDFMNKEQKRDEMLQAIRQSKTSCVEYIQDFYKN